MYKYGMRLRGFSISCQPMTGLEDHYEDPTGKYYDILVYDRELSEKEIADYELDPIRDTPEDDPRARVKSIRAYTGLSQQGFSKKYSIPKRTIENWESGKTIPPEYVVELLARVVEIDYPRKDYPSFKK